MVSGARPTGVASGGPGSRYRPAAVVTWCSARSSTAAPRGTCQATRAAIAALATAALSMLFFASFGYGIRHAVMGRFEEFPLWLVGISLAGAAPVRAPLSLR